MKQARGKNQFINTHPQRRKTMKHRFTTHLTALAAVALLLFGASQAMAYTPAGTSIENKATLSYSVNAIDQNDVDSTDGNGNEFTSFVVDRIVRPVVTRNMVTNPLVVTPGSTSQVLTFTVENDANDVSDGLGGTFDSKFTFNVVADGGNTVVPSSISYEVDTVSYSLGDPISIASDANITFTVIADFAKTALNGQVAKYYLVATAVADDGTTALATTAADATQNVFLDDAASVDVAYQGTDAANDGTHSDSAQYTVESANLTVTKTQSIINDGVGGTSYYLPGATVRYQITIENAGAVDADDVTVTDTIPASTTWVGNLTAAGSDSAGQAGGTVTVTYGSIASGSSVTITFDVSID
jgi:uncharacterized repeat protein (TIGR01451 family)